MKFLIGVLICVLCSTVARSQIHAAKYDPSNANEIKRVYVGHVNSIPALEYDSIFQLMYAGKYNQLSLRKSPYKIEVRISCSGHNYLHNSISLYWDSVFRIKYLDYATFAETFKVSMPQNSINVDSIYDKFVENSLFTLSTGEPIDSSYKSLVLANERFTAFHFYKQFYQHEGCLVEYKVDDNLNIFLMQFWNGAYEKYPDNQLLRRQHGIMNALKYVYKL